MCGIAGFVDFNKQVSNPLKKIQVLLDGISKRGPDSSQHLSLEPAFFAHSLLTITSIKNPVFQPFVSDCGRFVLCFNGEIYNYKKLAQEYFNDQNALSDTKVLLKLWVLFGEKSISLLQGMFAFSVWDRIDQRLFLVKDHLGIKPLYYFYDKDIHVFAFCSLAKPLAQAFDCNIQQENYSQELGCCLGSDTIFSNVKNLEAGHYLVFDEKSVTLQAWYDIKTSSNLAKNQIFEEVFLETLQAYFPDEKFGIFLSDGIDSTLIACAAKQLGREFYTFTVGIENTFFARDEREGAKKTAQFLNTDHHEFVLTKNNKEGLWQEFLQAQDLPSTDGFNTFLVARLAKNFCRVVFSGLGADELFLGYKYVYDLKNWISLSKEPAWLQKTAFRFGGLISALPKGKGLISRLNLKFLSQSDKADLFEKYLFYRCLDGVKINADKLQFMNQRFFSSDWQDIIAWELLIYDQYKLLRDSDSLTSHFGLELRVPFLDPNMIAFALNKDLVLGKKDLVKLLKKFYPNYKLKSKQGFVVAI